MKKDATTATGGKKKGAGKTKRGVPSLRTLRKAVSLSMALVGAGTSSARAKRGGVRKKKKKKKQKKKKKKQSSSSLEPS